MASVSYELLAGEQPNFGADVAKLRGIGGGVDAIVAAARRTQEETGALRPIGKFDVPIQAPMRLIAICNKALELEPENRYQTAGEMAADLTGFLHRPPLARRLVVGASLAVGVQLLVLAVAAVASRFGVVGNQEARERPGQPPLAARKGMIPLRQLDKFWSVKRPRITNPAVLRVRPELLPPNVTLDNDTMRLVNRGYAVSQKEFPDGAFVEFEWKWRDGDGTYSDHLTVVFRTSGEPQEKWPHEVKNGVAVRFVPYGHTIAVWRPSGAEFAEHRLGEHDKARLSRDYWHTIRIEDDGQALSVFFDDLAQPVIRVDLPGDFEHHRLAIYNREAVGGQNKESLIVNMAMGALHDP